MIIGYRVAIVGPDEMLADAQLYAPNEIEIALRYYRLLQNGANAKGCDVQLERAVALPKLTAEGAYFDVVYQTIERAKGPDP